MDPLVLASLIVAASAPIAGRLAGRLAARNRWVEPGTAKATMPVPPASAVLEGASPARRFDASVDRAAKVIRRHVLDRGAGGVTAQELAASLSLPPDVATAALEQLRANAPCRLRVTGSGKLIHHFDIEKLRVTPPSTGSFLARVMLFLAGVVANVGAIWPVIMALLGSVLALASLRSEGDETFYVAVGVLLAVPLAFGAVLGGGVVVGALLTPVIPSPRLGNALPKPEEKKTDEKKEGAAEAPKPPSNRESKRVAKRRRKAEAKRAQVAASPAATHATVAAAEAEDWQSLVKETDTFGLSGIAGTLLLCAIALAVPAGLVWAGAALFGVTVGSFLLGVCIVAVVILFIVMLFVTEDFSGAAIATPLVVLGLLLGVALFSVVAVIMWLAGLWVSLTEQRAPTLAPGAWVQKRGTAHDVTALIASNDVVLRAQLALRRALARARPVDPSMVARLAGKAAEGSGKLSALEIVLDEGLDEETAIAIGARASAHAGGEIDVTDGGEIVFSFPNALPVAASDSGSAAEVFTLTPRGVVAPIGIPVNVPGVTLADLEGAERLCAGTAMMFALALASHFGWVSALLPAATWAAPSWVALVCAALLSGSFILTGSLRYVARAEARAGFYRDVRRATLEALKKAAATEARVFDARAFAGDLHAASVELWPALPIEPVLREVEVACDGLGLELDPERMVEDAAARPYALHRLRERLEAARDTAPRRRAAAADDEIVFDSGEDMAAARAAAVG